MRLDAKRQVGRPLAATLILASCLVLGGLVLASMLAGLWSATAERDAKADFMSRSLASSRRALNPAGGAPLSLLADTETLAAARLDDLLRSTALDADAAVLSSRAEAKPDEPGPHRRIELQAMLEGRIDALQKLLYRLETGTPMVLVDEFTLGPSEAGTVGGDPRAPLLRASLTLSAFWAKPERR